MNGIGLGRRSPSAWSGILIVIGIAGLGMFLGFAVGVLPWIFSLGIVLVPLVLLSTAAFPWIGLLIALALLYEVIPRAFAPSLPAFGARLQAYDLMLIFLALLFFIRLLIKPGSTPLRDLGALRWPLYYLTVMFALSFVYGFFFAGNVSALTEAREQIAWLVLPLAVALFPGHQGLRRLVYGVVIIAVVIALYVSIQSLFDVRIMTAARVESLDAAFRDVTRSIAGGGSYLLVFALFYLLNLSLDRPRRMLWALPIVVLLLLAIAFQFGRGLWIAATVGVLLSAYIHRGFGGAGAVALFGGLLVALLLASLATIKPQIVYALVDRLTGVGDELLTGSSFQWRVVENREALARIAERPLTGVGIGGDYKFVTTTGYRFEIETFYIHNSYLYFPLKMGVFATLIPFAFLAAFVTTIWRCLRQPSLSDHKALLGALAGSFIVPMITSITQPEWASAQGIGAFSLFMAMAVILQRASTPAGTSVHCRVSSTSRRTGAAA